MYSHAETTDWKEAQKNARHYLAVGIDRVYLERAKPSADFDKYPWDLAHVREGCSIRYNVPITFNFVAPLPEGIEIHWSIDIENEGASGSAALDLNLQMLKRVLAALNPKASNDMKKELQLHACRLMDDVNKAKSWLERCQNNSDALEEAIKY